MLATVPLTADTAPLPAEHYRREAAKARKAAESVTTRAIKARLLDLARDFDRKAEEAESVARQPARAVR